MAEIYDLNTTDAQNTARWPSGTMLPSAIDNSARALEGILARGFRSVAVPQNATMNTARTVISLAAPSMDSSTLRDGLRVLIRINAGPNGFLKANGMFAYGSLPLKGLAKLGASGPRAIEATDIHRNGLYELIYNSVTDKWYVLNPGVVGTGEIVQADWNAGSGVSQILNKPAWPPTPVQADVNQTDATALDYIKNLKKPVQADFAETDSSQPDFIRNKPSVYPEPVQADWNVTDTSSLAFIRNKPILTRQIAKLRRFTTGTKWRWSNVQSGYIGTDHATNPYLVVNYNIFNNTYGFLIGIATTDGGTPFIQQTYLAYFPGSSLLTQLYDSGTLWASLYGSSMSTGKRITFQSLRDVSQFLTITEMRNG